jgi:hypothetical protein
MLTRGDDYVVVAPGSRLLLPNEEPQSGFTRLVQQVGTMLYKVHHTGIPHFAVQTPMLAAVVKGTSFTIIVDQDRAAVQVTQGIVEVSSAAGQSKRLVERGTTVYVGRERPDTIVELKNGAPEMPAAPKSETVKVSGTGDVPLSAITDLTGGLVRAAPTAPTLALVSQTGTAISAPVPGSTSQPVLAVVDGVLGTATNPVSGIVDTVSSATQPVAGIVQGTVPAVTQPIVNTVTTTVPTVTQPIVNTVTTTVPTVTQPVVNTVVTTAPTVTQPVVNIVTTTVPTVTQPVTSILSGPSLLGHP